MAPSWKGCGAAPLAPGRRKAPSKATALPPVDEVEKTVTAGCSEWEEGAWVSKLDHRILLLLGLLHFSNLLPYYRDSMNSHYHN